MDLKELSIKEINELIKELNDEINERAKKEERELILEIKRRTQILNIKPEDLLKKLKNTREKKQPKYQNPDDNNQKWNGLGAKPKWFREQLQKGNNPENMLIKKTD